MPWTLVMQKMDSVYVKAMWKDSNVTDVGLEPHPSVLTTLLAVKGVCVTPLVPF